MLSIELPSDIEKKLNNVVQQSYNGNLQFAIISFLKLHEKYGWKEQLLQDVESIRSEVRRKGGIKSKEIDAAVRRYRKELARSNA